MRFKKHHITLLLAFVAGMACAPCHGQLFKRRGTYPAGNVTDVSSTGAVKYAGRWYNGPVCSNPNCAMCNKIRAAQASARSTATPVSTPVTRTVAKPAPMTHVTEWVPTPEEAISEIVPLLGIESKHSVYDLGCGDGRFVIEACSQAGCAGVGIELNAETATKAKARARLCGVSQRVKIVNADVLAYRYPTADVVFMYLYPDLMRRVLPRLRRGTRVVSYLHPLPGSREIVTPSGHIFHYLIVN